MPEFDITIVIVSFNTREILRDCLQSVQQESAGLKVEIIVVDNGSRDESGSMVAEEFPQVQLMDHPTNVGFGAANNMALAQAKGRYVVLLNSDAFLKPGALHLAVEHMDATPAAGMGGGQLLSEDGSWQPSAHAFPNVLLDFFMLSGLADIYPRSRIFGHMNRSWDVSLQPAEVDWLTGAFLILRPEALRKVGSFDEEFFLYFEEVDLCRRMKRAGYQIWFWPDIQITHLGGASARGQNDLLVSTSGSQIMLWHMRSSLLYYRKYHGMHAWLIMLFESFWYWLRAVHNEHSSEPYAAARAADCRLYVKLMRQSWKETRGGHISPPRPW